jgi:hypothetical protein
LKEGKNMQGDEYSEFLAEFSAMSVAELEAFERQFDAEVARAEAQARSTASRSPSPTPTPAPTRPTAPKPAPAPTPAPEGHDVAEGFDSLEQPGDSPFRDPAFCFQNAQAIREWSLANLHTPINRLGPIPISHA